MQILATLHHRNLGQIYINMSGFRTSCYVFNIAVIEHDAQFIVLLKGYNLQA
jgi:hypothetical protein